VTLKFLIKIAFKWKIYTFIKNILAFLTPK
jgi:hypothetical protein